MSKKTRGETKDFVYFGFEGGAAESRGRTQNQLSRSPAREWREFLERIVRSCILRDDGGKGV